MSSSFRRLSDNLSRVQERIHAAAISAGRDPSTIELIAVTKYVDASVIRQLHELGCRHFGESRPQALWDKAEELSDLDLNWHQIGHLQSNKVRRTLPSIKLLHSGDSLKLLERIQREAAAQSRVVDTLCEVNISGDSSKHGFTPEKLTNCLDQIAEFPNVRVLGLMAMASQAGGLERAQQDFEKMESLFHHLQGIAAESIQLHQLSMGMSGDFEVAIRHGATLIRIGSILYDGIL